MTALPSLELKSTVQQLYFTYRLSQQKIILQTIFTTLDFNQKMQSHRLVIHNKLPQSAGRLLLNNLPKTLKIMDEFNA